MNKKEKTRESLVPPPTKVVVRQLPPEFTGEDFRACCNTLCADQMGLQPGREGFEVLQFCQGKHSRRKGVIPGVGYLMINNLDAAKQFILLVATSGIFQTSETGGGPEAAMLAVHAMEAPCQKLPNSLKRGLRRDNRAGTYKKDPLFKKFLEQLETPVEKLPSAEVQLDQKLASGESEEPVVPTLVEYLKKRRETREKQRQLRKEELSAKKARKDQRKNIEKEREKVKDKKGPARKKSGKDRETVAPAASEPASNIKPASHARHAAKEEERLKKAAAAKAHAAAEREKAREARRASAAARTSGSAKQQVKILSKALGSAAATNTKPMQLLPRPDANQSDTNPQNHPQVKRGMGSKPMGGPPHSQSSQKPMNTPPHPQHQSRPPFSGSNKRGHPSGPPKQHQQYVPKGTKPNMGGSPNSPGGFAHVHSQGKKPNTPGGGRGGVSIMQRQPSGQASGVPGKPQGVSANDQQGVRTHGGRGSGRGGYSGRGPHQNTGRGEHRGPKSHGNRANYQSRAPKQEYRRKTDVA